MKKAVIDFHHIKSPDEVYDCLGGKLDFPKYFGRNLDALYDVLTDICSETRIYISGRPDFEGGADLLHVLKDAERVNGSLSLNFVK